MTISYPGIYEDCYVQWYLTKIERQTQGDRHCERKNDDTFLLGINHPPKIRPHCTLKDDGH